MLRLAEKQAHKSPCRAQHGAVVASGKRVFGTGFNVYKSPGEHWGTRKLHSRNSYEFFTTHAEAAAIRDAKRRRKDLTGTTLYVTRAGGRLSKPCADCQKLIEEHGISKVVYTDGEGNIVSEWPL